MRFSFSTLISRLSSPIFHPQLPLPTSCHILTLALTTIHRGAGSLVRVTRGKIFCRSDVTRWLVHVAGLKLAILICCSKKARTGEGSDWLLYDITLIEVKSRESTS